jgi:hypothetical protein
MSVSQRARAHAFKLMSRMRVSHRARARAHPLLIIIVLLVVLPLSSQTEGTCTCLRDPTLVMARTRHKTTDMSPRSSSQTCAATDRLASKLGLIDVVRVLREERLGAATSAAGWPRVPRNVDEMIYNNDGAIHDLQQGCDAASRHVATKWYDPLSVSTRIHVPYAAPVRHGITDSGWQMYLFALCIVRQQLLA